MLPASLATCRPQPAVPRVRKHLACADAHPNAHPSPNERAHPPDCCPTQATICAMLIGEPLEPHWLMMRGELW